MLKWCVRNTNKFTMNTELQLSLSDVPVCLLRAMFPTAWRETSLHLCMKKVDQEHHQHPESRYTEKKKKKDLECSIPTSLFFIPFSKRFPDASLVCQVLNSSASDCLCFECILCQFWCYFLWSDNFHGRQAWFWWVSETYCVVCW